MRVDVVDACDRCHRYIKTIDLSKDGLAVPCVDDIASLSLDLWARERGYTRIKNHVLGIWAPSTLDIQLPPPEGKRANNGFPGTGPGGEPERFAINVGG